MQKETFEVVKEYGDVAVVKFYANEWKGTYGDISSLKSDIEPAYPGAKILQGYGIINLSTGYCHEEAKDWYDSKEEALDEALSLS